MKKLTKLSFVTLMLLGASQFSYGAKTYKTWKQPHVLKENIGCLKLKNVIFTDTATIVEFVSENNPGNIRFADSSFLLGENGKHYQIKGCKEYKLDEWMPVAKKTVPVTLWFEPMPKKTQVFDLMEGVSVGWFKFLGISDAKKPYQAKPFAFCEDSIKAIRKNFFCTDSVTLRGKIANWPKEGKEGVSYIVNHTDALTSKDEPWAILVNKDGSFERKMRIDYLMLEESHADNNYSVGFPFILVPGQKVDLTYYPDGKTQYNSTDKLSWGSIGAFHPSLFYYLPYPSAYELKDKVDFKEFAKLTERDMDAKLQLLDYVAERFKYSQLEYYLTRLNIQAGCGQCLFDYSMYKVRNDQAINLDSLKAAGDPIAQIYDLENYSLLRRIPVNDPLLLAVPQFHMLQNRYKWSEIILKPMNDARRASKYLSEDSIRIDIDKRIFGGSEPSLLVKTILASGLMNEVSSLPIKMEQINWGNDFPTQESREAQLKKINEMQTELFFKRMKQINQPFLEAKVKAEYDYCQSAKLVNELPDCEATKMLRKYTDKYKGKYLFIDFWGISCGPCRSGIERSEAVRKQLRDEKDFDFLYFTSMSWSREKEYNEYVQKHLEGEDCVRVNNAEFSCFQELFKFLGIPHYVLLDPQGRMLNMDAGYPYHCRSKESFMQYFNDIRSRAEKK